MKKSMLFSLMLVPGLFLVQFTGIFAEDTETSKDLPWEQVKVAFLSGGVNPEKSPAYDDIPVEVRKSFVKEEVKSGSGKTSRRFNRLIKGQEGQRSMTFFDLQVQDPSSDRADAGAVAKALSWIQQYNTSHEQPIHLVFLPFTNIHFDSFYCGSSIGHPGMIRCPKDPDYQESTVESGVKEAMKTGSSVIVPAGDESRPIIGKNIRTDSFPITRPPNCPRCPPRTEWRYRKTLEMEIVLPAASSEAFTVAGVRKAKRNEDGEIQPGLVRKWDEKSNFGTGAIDFLIDYRGDRQSSFSAALQATRVASAVIADAFGKDAEDQLSPERLRTELNEQARTIDRLIGYPRPDSKKMGPDRLLNPNSRFRSTIEN